MFLFFYGNGCRSVEVFTFGEDICTCGLQASLTPLRAICELQASSTRTAIFAFFDYQTLHIARIFRKIVSFCTLFPLFPNSPIPVVVSYVVKTEIADKSRKWRAEQSLFSPLANPTRVKKYTRNICLVCCIIPLKRRKSKSFG